MYKNENVKFRYMTNFNTTEKKLKAFIILFFLRNKYYHLYVV